MESQHTLCLLVYLCVCAHAKLTLPQSVRKDLEAYLSTKRMLSFLTFTVRIIYHVKVSVSESFSLRVTVVALRVGLCACESELRKKKTTFACSLITILLLVSLYITCDSHAVFELSGFILTITLVLCLSRLLTTCTCIRVVHT